MKETKIFTYLNKTVRTIYAEDANGNMKPWFHWNDVCAILEIAHPSDKKREIREGHIKTFNMETKKTARKDGTIAVQTADVNFVDETGLYISILRSRKPEAEDFAYYIAEVVIPELRRTGGYFIGMENLSGAQKEEAREDLKELQAKYSALEKEFEEVTEEYRKLFTKTKEMLGVHFVLGTEPVNEDDWCTDEEGFLIPKSLFLSDRAS